jgi:hypothetical protein
MGFNKKKFCTFQSDEQTHTALCQELPTTSGMQPIIMPPNSRKESWLSLSLSLSLLYSGDLCTLYYLFIIQKKEIIFAK